MEIDWSNEWNRRMFKVLNRTSVVEIGLLASRDVEAARVYEQKLADAKQKEIASYFTKTS